MTEFALFASSYTLVLLLGLQSLNVNNGHRWAAFLTSFGIGASNLILFKHAPDANTTEMLAYLIGGPFGIVTAMWLHPRTVRRKGKIATKTFAEDMQAKSWQQHQNDLKTNTNFGADRP